MNRYKVTIQHEVIVYGESIELAKRVIMNHPEYKQRTNLQCMVISQIPMPEQESTEITDNRTAPGS